MLLQPIGWMDKTMEKKNRPGFLKKRGKAGDFGNSVVYSLIFKQNMTAVLSI